MTILKNDTLTFYVLTEMVGMAEIPSKFSSLDWIDLIDELGIVAGGMDDGAVTLWNIKKILAQND